MNERMFEKQEKKSNNRNRMATEAYANSEQFVFLHKCNIENWYILLDGEKCGTQCQYLLWYIQTFTLYYMVYL